MPNNNIYDANLIELNLIAKDKFEAIQKMTDLIVTSNRGRNKEKIVEDVLKRDEVGTPQVDGIAIPHARSSGIDTPTVVFARASSPIIFDPEEIPASVLLMIVVPENGGDQHLEILANLARKLMDQEFTQVLRNSNNKTEILDLLNKEKEHA